MDEYTQNMQFKGLISNNCITEAKQAQPKKKITSLAEPECCFLNENLYWNKETKTSWCKVCGTDTLIPF